MFNSNLIMKMQNYKFKNTFQYIYFPYYVSVKREILSFWREVAGDSMKTGWFKNKGAK